METHPRFSDMAYLEKITMLLCTWLKGNIKSMMGVGMWKVIIRLVTWNIWREHSTSIFQDT
jgi:hypothetical protein